MPCGDIKEAIRLTIDDNNNIDSYHLSKVSCGGAVGLESLILDMVGGKNIDSFNEASASILNRLNKSHDNIEEFLKAKHLYAIQSVIRVFLGEKPGGIDDICTIAGIEFDGGKTIIDAEINIDILDDKIEACAHCGPY